MVPIKFVQNKHCDVTADNGSQRCSGDGSYPKWEKTNSQSGSKHAAIAGKVFIKNISFCRT